MLIHSARSLLTHAPLSHTREHSNLSRMYADEGLSHRPGGGPTTPHGSSGNKAVLLQYASIATWLLLFLLAVVVFAGGWLPTSGPTSVKPPARVPPKQRALCRNTQQGKLYVTDDRGTEGVALIGSS